MFFYFFIDNLFHKYQKPSKLLLKEIKQTTSFIKKKITSLKKNVNFYKEKEKFKKYFYILKKL